VFSVSPWFVSECEPEIAQIEHLENAIERSAAAERDALLEASVHSWCGENWCPV
jgi:hypothetical protein